jgi:hypothetical protein
LDIHRVATIPRIRSATTPAPIRVGAQVGILDLPNAPSESVLEQNLGPVPFVPGGVTSTEGVTAAPDDLAEHDICELSSTTQA